MLWTLDVLGVLYAAIVADRVGVGRSGGLGRGGQLQRAKVGAGAGGVVGEGVT